MQLKINLATRNYINARQLNLAFAVMILLMLLWLFSSIKEIAYNYGEMKRISKDIAGSEEKFKAEGKGVSENDYRAVLARIAFANSVIERKSFDWLTLLDILETVVPDGIALKGIEPDPKKQMLKLSGTGRTFKNVRQLMENLEGSRNFTNVFLETQAEIKVGQNQKGMNFTIVCKVVYK